MRMLLYGLVDKGRSRRPMELPNKASVMMSFDRWFELEGCGFQNTR